MWICALTCVGPLKVDNTSVLSPQQPTDTPADELPDAWALLIKVASLFKFLIHMLICLPAFSDWPTTVIIVSRHRVALPAPSATAAAAAQQFRRSKLKPRLITIKARHKYYAFVPETIIATIPFTGAQMKKTARGRWWQASLCIMSGATCASLALGATAPAEICGKSAHVVKLARSKEASQRSPCCCN